MKAPQYLHTFCRDLRRTSSQQDAGSNLMLMQSRRCEDWDDAGAGKSYKIVTSKDGTKDSKKRPFSHLGVAQQPHSGKGQDDEGGQEAVDYDTHLFLILGNIDWVSIFLTQS